MKLVHHTIPLTPTHDHPQTTRVTTPFSTHSSISTVSVSLSSSYIPARLLNPKHTIHKPSSTHLNTKTPGLSLQIYICTYVYIYTYITPLTHTTDTHCPPPPLLARSARRSCTLCANTTVSLVVGDVAVHTNHPHRPVGRPHHRAPSRKPPSLHFSLHIYIYIYKTQGATHTTTTPPGSTCVRTYPNHTAPSNPRHTLLVSLYQQYTQPPTFTPVISPSPNRVARATPNAKSIQTGFSAATATTTTTLSRSNTNRNVYIIYKYIHTYSK